MTSRLLYAFLLSLTGLLAAEADPVIPVWPGDAPGSEGKTATEKVRLTPEDGEHVVSSVHRPTLTLFLPTAAQASGAAVIVCPGGGHRELWMDHEGYNVGRWLAAHGVAALVLKYRLAREEGSDYKVEEHSLADAQRAIRLVRSRAGEWGVDPARVGMMGFSAGGELAALAALRGAAGRADAVDPVERQDSKPTFQALIYPGNSGIISPARGAPRAFLVCGAEDRLDISEGIAQVYLKFKQAGVPAELHVYARAGHGFGVRDRNRGPSRTWPERFHEWLGVQGLLVPAP
jgi:acetyl esterase/lipase